MKTKHLEIIAVVAIFIAALFAIVYLSVMRVENLKELIGGIATAAGLAIFLLLFFVDD